MEVEEEQGERYLMNIWVLEKPQHITGKMNRLQKMLDKLQQLMDKINRTPQGQDKLQQVVGKAE